VLSNLSFFHSSSCRGATERVASLWDTLFPALTHIVRYSITDPQKINGMQWALRSSRGESNRYRTVHRKCKQRCWGNRRYLQRQKVSLTCRKPSSNIRTSLYLPACKRKRNPKRKVYAACDPVCQKRLISLPSTQFKNLSSSAPLCAPYARAPKLTNKSESALYSSSSRSWSYTPFSTAATPSSP